MKSKRCGHKYLSMFNVTEIRGDDELSFGVCVCSFQEGMGK